METPLDYLNFDLAFESLGADSYRAEVLNSPSGSAATAFRRVFSNEDLDRLVFSLSRGEADANLLVKDFGWRLFNAAFGGGVQDRLNHALAEAGRQGLGLCLRLRFAKAPELAELPWEFLFYPPFNSFLALLDKVTIVRYLEQNFPLPPALVELPLKVLTVISDPSDMARFDAAVEWQSLKANLQELEQAGLIELELLEKAGQSDLQMKLLWSRYHILHYIGPGFFDHDRNEGVLALTDENGQSQLLDSSFLATMLHDHDSLRLAIFQAVPGAVSTLDDGFESTAQNLLVQGLPAVLALTYATSPEATRALVALIYGTLTNGQLLAPALNKAREQLYAKGHDFEWGSVQLYTSATDNRLFEFSGQNNIQKAGQLFREAQGAIAGQNWAIALDLLQEARQLDATNSQIEPQISEVRRQLEYADTYRRGRELYEARQWQEALPVLKELQAQVGSYRDISLLINRSTAGFRQQQIAQLEQISQTVFEQQNWDEAISRTEKLLELDPNRATGPAGERLAQARQNKQLLELYTKAQQAYQAENWCEAFALFEQLQSQAPDYRDVGELLVSSDQKCRLSKIAPIEVAADAAIAHQDWATAAAHLEELLQLDPFYYAAREKQARVQEQMALAALPAVPPLSPVAPYAETQNQTETENQTQNQNLPLATESYEAVALAPPRLNFLNFDLSFEPFGSSYRANLLNSPAGRASVTFQIPLSSSELDELARSLHQSEANARQLCRDFGWKLFNAVFVGELNTALSNSLADARQQKRWLRLRLNFAQTPDLADLPWEYLYYPTFNSYLALLTEAILLRQSQEENFAPPALKPPLRGLAIISPQAESDWQNLNAKLQNLQLGNFLQLDYLPAANLGQLKQQLEAKQYHLLHFIGPATFDETSGEACLLLLDRAGESQAVNSSQLLALFNRQPALRLVLLQASREMPLTRTDPLGEIAQSLTGQGFAAALNLPYPGNPAVTNTFLLSLYENLLQTTPLDEALSLSQTALFHQGYDIEWGTFRLYLGIPDGRVFDIEPPSKAQQAAALLQQARAGMAGQDWGQAVSWLEQALTLEPDNQEVSGLLAEAKQQAELANFYSKGQKFYQSGDWCAALEQFRQLEKRVGNYKDLAQLLPVAAENCQRASVQQLLQQAEIATQQNDWANAVASYERLLELAPHIGVQPRLEEARRQQRMYGLYQEGLNYRQNARWPEALVTFRLALQGNPPNRAQLEQLVAEAEGQLAEGDKQARANTLQAEIASAIEREDWEGASSRLEQMRQLGPEQAQEGQPLLAQLQEKQEIARLYQEGVNAYEAGRGAAALTPLYQVRAKAGQYKNTEELITEVEQRSRRLSPARITTASQLGSGQPVGAANNSAIFVPASTSVPNGSTSPIPDFRSNSFITPPAPSPDAPTVLLSHSSLMPPPPPVISPANDYPPQTQTPDYDYSSPPVYNYPAPSAVSYNDTAAAPYYNNGQATTGNYYANSNPANVGPSPSYAQSPSPRRRSAAQAGPLAKFWRVCWLILFGWWLGLFHAAIGYLVCLTVLFMREGISFLNRLPITLTLFSPSALRTLLADFARPLATLEIPQRNFLLRLAYFGFIGWWLGLIWTLLGYFMSFRSKNILTALEIFDSLPQVMTLYRAYDEASFAAKFPPTEKDKRSSSRLTILLIIWALVPLTLLLVWLARVILNLN